MKFETFNSGKFSSKKKIYLGVTVIVLVLVVSVSLFSYAKYKNVESVKLAEGTVNYRVPDLNLVAMYQENNSGDGMQ